MTIETMSTLEREGARTSTMPSHACAAARHDSNGGAWVICLTDANWREDGITAETAAKTANRAFREAYGAYESLSTGRRLTHALLNANEQLDSWWKDEPGERRQVALTAVALDENGADYIAVGKGNIAVFDDQKVTIVRQSLHDPTGEAGPRAGLRGLELRPDCAERGRYPTPPNPKGTIVIGTELLGCLDEEAFRWTASMKLKPHQLVRALVDAVAEETRNRRPGVSVTAAADW